MSCVKKLKTHYKGYLFDSGTDARWAVFFDMCHADWEYQPETYDLGNGQYYQPTFLLHDVSGRGSGYLYVEVNTDIKDSDAKKIRIFADAGNPVLIVGKIPEGETIDDIDDYVRRCAYSSCFCVYRYNFETIDEDHFAAHPGINEKGRFELFGDDSSYLQHRRDSDTEAAYRKARQAGLKVGFETRLEVDDES